MMASEKVGPAQAKVLGLYGDVAPDRQEGRQMSSRPREQREHVVFSISPSFSLLVSRTNIKDKIGYSLVALEQI